MKFLIAGLGSMGKRRIRCLKALGVEHISGFDKREDRRGEAAEKYGIRVYGNFETALRDSRPDALIISVPPDVHHEYMKISIREKIHFFVEASVVDTDMDLIKSGLKQYPIVGAPSATLLFHPAIRKISEILDSGILGKVSNITFHSGQYLPDWHSYESVRDYYVSNPATGGAREIVPFEMAWFTRLFGFPEKVCGNFRKTITIEGAERIEDTYNFLLDYKDFLASVTVDVVSRYATRRLVVNGSERQLVWDWNLKKVDLYNPALSQWEEQPYEMKTAAAGYNPNIGENMYIDELDAFIRAAEGGEPFINTMENDHRVLKMLYAIEESDRESKYIGLEA